MKRLISDMDIIELFEETVADYAGSKYGVAISSGTNAIFLCLQYLLYKRELRKGDTITLPSRTYLSVPCMIKNSGLNIKFKDMDWSGMYQLKPTRIYDCAVRFNKDMFVGGNILQCLSFQYRKFVKIGRGGMILTNDKEAAKWFKEARFNGRHVGVSQQDDILDFCGWNMYMTPESAARGLTIFTTLSDHNGDCANQDSYPDLKKQKVFK